MRVGVRSDGTVGYEEVFVSFLTLRVSLQGTRGEGRIRLSIGTKTKKELTPKGAGGLIPESRRSGKCKEEDKQKGMQGLFFFPPTMELHVCKHMGK
jgi:hypothetical protein